MRSFEAISTASSRKAFPPSKWTWDSNSAHRSRKFSRTVSPIGVDTEFLEHNTCGSVGNVAPECVESQRFRARVTHDDGCGRAVANGGTISGSHGSLGVERRLEFCKDVKVRISAWNFVGRE